MREMQEITHFHSQQCLHFSLALVQNADETKSWKVYLKMTFGENVKPPVSSHAVFIYT